MKNFLKELRARHNLKQEDLANISSKEGNEIMDVLGGCAKCDGYDTSCKHYLVKEYEIKNT